MSEEIMREEAVENVVETTPEPTVKTKKGTGTLVLGILTFLFMAIGFPVLVYMGIRNIMTLVLAIVFAGAGVLFLLAGLILGIIAIIKGILHLTKKGVKKVCAIVGLVLAVLGITASVVIGLSAYNYVTKTDLFTIMEDIKEVTGGAIDLKETVNETIQEYVGEDFDVEKLEEFVGDEFSVEQIQNFIGDTTPEEVQEFIENFNVELLFEEFGDEFTYEDIVDKLGEDFTFEDFKEYMESLE